MLTEKVYQEGRSRGIVGLDAIGELADLVIATAWYPKYEEDHVQGWSANLKLSIASPLASVRRIPHLLWFLVRRLPGYQRYQKGDWMIGTREWAAAEPGAAGVDD